MNKERICPACSRTHIDRQNKCDRCRKLSAAKPAKCTYCGNTYLSHPKLNRMFCSRSCKARSQGSPPIPLSSPVRYRTCDCGITLLLHGSGIGRLRCDSCRRKRNSAYAAQHYRDQITAGITPLALRRSHLKRTNGPSDDIEHFTVFERDGWICQLCNEPVDDTLPWPHPMSKSLDHKQPLTRGGLHSYDNVQLSHLRCNIQKSNH